MPGLLGTGRGLRSGQRQDEGGARWRRVGHPGPEGLDVSGHMVRLVLRRVPDRPHRPEARGDLLSPLPDAPVRRRRAAYRPAHRHLGVQRGVLRRRPHGARQRRRRRQRWLAGRHGDPRLRAGCLDHRPPGRLRGRARRGDRRGARPGCDRRCRHPAAAGAGLDRPARHATQLPAHTGALGTGHGRRRGVDRQALLGQLAPGARGAGDGRARPGGRGRGGTSVRSHRRPAELLVQPGRHHLRRLEPDPAQHHR